MQLLMVDAVLRDQELTISFSLGQGVMRISGVTCL